MILPFALVTILFTILIVRTVFASGGSDLNQEGVAVAFLGDLGLEFAGEPPTEVVAREEVVTQ